MTVPSLEHRVRELEGFRYRMLGRVNALQTMLLDCWMQVIEKTPDPVATAEAMKRTWLTSLDQPGRRFPGVDPAHLDVVAYEARQALDDLTDELLRTAVVAKSARRHKG